MNEIFTSHRSIRQYKATPIDETFLNEILYTGLRSSSSGNMQTWSMVVTQDEGLKQQLYKAHFEQPMILQAPLVLTFCSDVFRMREWIRVNDSKQSFDDLLGFLTGAADAIIAAQSICLAAESVGLGICYMGTTWWSADKIIEILELPTHVFPVTSIVMGYPDENPALRDRLPLELIVHREKYQRMGDAEVLDTHAERAQNAWARYTANPELKEKLAKAGITKVTDYYTSKYKYSKELHARVSEMLIEMLQRQGLWV